LAFSFLGRGGGSSGGPHGGNGAKFTQLAEVRAYWEGLRGGSGLPRRDQIDPRGIAGALDTVFLLERVAPGVARFRLAGMQVNDLLGMDVRGMPLSAMIDPGARPRMAEALNTLFAGPAILTLGLEAERSVGRPALEGRLLLLPLISARGPCDLALGCLATHGATGRAPRRFDISSLTSEALVSIEAELDAASRPRPQQAPRLVPMGLSEPAAGFTPAPKTPPRGKPYLRLVKG
jgi:hypothetical protein